MTDLELAEHSPRLTCRLNDAAGRALAASGVVEATPDPGSSGVWQLKARGKVGAVSVTVPGEQPVLVRITPKLPIGRLFFLLGYSQNPKGWRDDLVDVAAEDGLVPVIALLFERQAEPALRQGLLQGYRTAEERALVVRGRVREADQLRRHYGMTIPVEIRHDEYTADIAENQLLRTACERLLRMPFGVPVQVRSRLRRLKLRLAEITPVDPGSELPKWMPTRLNARYHTALRIADLVLRGGSVEHYPGDVTINGFLFEMSTVYEDFVTTALRQALSDSEGYCDRPPKLHLDEQDSIRIVPDLVWYGRDGTPQAVVDAKYKAEKPSGYPDADLYQMLAYCLALRLSAGHLVYAKGNVPRGSHRVRNTDVTIHQQALNLDQPANVLLAEIRELADLLRDTKRRC